MDPLQFEPWLRPQVWGGRRLGIELGKHLPDDRTYGESWELSSHPQHVSRVANGPWRGRSLADLWSQQQTSLTGKNSDREPFPLLIKFLDCHELLSVQVHPDDRLAAQLIPGERGKTEAWVILAAEPDAVIYAGLKPGVTAEQSRRHSERGSVADCLHRLTPHAGDCLFLPAGTVHAVGKGVLMAEVQQSSDATFRLFDWNRPGPDGRPRQLHLDQSLQAIDWQRGPQEMVQPRTIKYPDGIPGERLVDCEFFRLDRITLPAGTAIRWPLPGTLSIGLVVVGTLELEGPSTEPEPHDELASRTDHGKPTRPSQTYRSTVHRGQTVLIPATASPELMLHATGTEAQLLIVQIP